MDISFTIGNKHLLFLITFSSLILVLSIATAYSPTASGGVPAAMGHSVDEMDWGNPLPFDLYVTGDVGIGTNSPAGKLQIFDISADSAEYVFTESSTSGYITTFNMDNTGLDIGHGSASRALNLKTNSQDRLTILGGGNVGISVPNPSERLEVAGNIRVTTGNDICIAGGNCLSTAGGGGVTGGGNANYIPRWTTGTNLADSVIYQNGNNIGIGTTNPGTYRVWIDGDLRVWGNVDFGTSSFSYDSATDTLTVGNIAPGNYCDSNGQNCRTFSSVGDITNVQSGVGTKGGAPGGAGAATIEFDCSEVDGTGITCSGESITADEAYLQRRVSSSCAAGSSIRAISSTGAVTCETDDNAGALSCNILSKTGIGHLQLDCPAGYTLLFGICGGNLIMHGDIGSLCYLTPNAINPTGIHDEGMPPHITRDIQIRCCRIS